MKSALSNFPLSQIHAAILTSDSIISAANELSVQLFTLENHLQNFDYQEAIITFNYFKKLSVEEAKTRFGEIYNQSVEGINIYVSKYTLEEVHDRILADSSLKVVEWALGIYQRSFAAYLEQFYYNNKPITLHSLQYISKETAQYLFGEIYHQVIVVPKKKLSDHTFARIHEQIRASNNMEEAAVRIGVYHKKLTHHFERFLIDQNVTFDVLKNLSPAEAHIKFGNKYFCRMTIARRDISTSSLAKIHKVVWNSESTEEIYDKLGVLPGPLKYYLSKFNYNDSYLTIGDLQNLSPQKAEEIYKDDYHQPRLASRGDFSNCTLSLLHSVILLSRDMTEVARYLGVCSKTITRSMGLARYNNEPLSFDQLKGMSSEGALQHFGDKYDKPLQIVKRSFYDHAIATIHAQIRASSTIDEAGIKLGMRGDTLTKELTGCTYKKIPLTYSRFKNLSIEEAQSYWKEAYNKPFVNGKHKRSWSMDENSQSPSPLPVYYTEPKEVSSSVTTSEPNQEIVPPFMGYSDSALTSSISSSLFTPSGKTVFAPLDSCSFQL